MAVVVGVATEDARKYFPQFFGRLLGISASTTDTVTPDWNPLIRSFKVGEGGWIDPGSGKVARTPVGTLRRVDNSIQDLDCIVDPTRLLVDQRYPADSLGYFEKALEDGDFAFEAPSTLRITCTLEAGDFNDDGDGNPPEIYEMGIFCDHPTAASQELMIAYTTFPVEVKDGQEITNIVRITF